MSRKKRQKPPVPGSEVGSFPQLLGKAIASSATAHANTLSLATNVVLRDVATGAVSPEDARGLIKNFNRINDDVNRAGESIMQHYIDTLDVLERERKKLDDGAREAGK